MNSKTDKADDSDASSMDTSVPKTTSKRSKKTLIELLNETPKNSVDDDWEKIGTVGNEKI